MESLRCMGCMQPLPEGRKACGLCGYPANGENPAEFLPVGTRLSDRYMVGRVRSVSGDSAVYIGLDLHEQTPIQIREFFPRGLCLRASDGSVSAVENCSSSFSDYLTRFHSHVRTLARLRELPILQPIFDIFDQNGTTYAISEHIDGRSLAAYLQQKGGRLTWEEARRLFLPFLSSLSECHEAGVFHYGISPDTLLVGAGNRLLLTGFALPQARVVSSNLKSHLPAGFAAPEQYDFGGSCSAATDVYGVAATLFFTLTGNPPPEGPVRDPQGRDLLLPREVSDHLPSHVATALDRALQVDPAKRPASVAELRDLLSSGAVHSLSEEPTATARKRKNPLNKYALFGGLFLALAVVVVAIVLIYAAFPGTDEPDNGPTTTVELPTTTTESRTASGDPSLTAPQLTELNMDYFSLPVVDGACRYIDFVVTLDGLVYSDLPYGTIVSQSPAPGELFTAGTPIGVIISAGPRPAIIPSVVGWREEHATRYLEALGFKVSAISEEVEGVAKGTVLGTLPEVGRPVDPGKGNSVVLRVSSWVAPPPQSVPEQ